MIIPFDGPLELSHTLECGQAFRWRPEGEWFLGTVGSAAMKVRKVPIGLEVRSSLEVTAGFVRSYFRLDDDLEAILKEISVDRHIRRAVEKYRGLRLLRQDPWECLVSYVASSASNIPKISRCIRKISERYGDRQELGAFVTYGFPAPETLAAAGAPALKECELGFRAGYIAGIARDMTDPDSQAMLTPQELRALRGVPAEQARLKLLEFKGVGEKVADCVLLFSLDKLETFPVDRWVQRVAERLFFNGRKLSPKKVREWGRAHYGCYAGYAQQYLFHYMRHLDP
jgi:N-glycosylase/DNA lyase